MRKKLKTWPMCSVVNCASFSLKFSRTLPKRQQKQLRKKKKKGKQENMKIVVLKCYIFFCFVYYSSTFTLERDNLYCCALIFPLFKCTWTQWKIWVYLMDWSNAQSLNVSYFILFSRSMIYYYLILSRFKVPNMHYFYFSSIQKEKIVFLQLSLEIKYSQRQ